MHRLQCEVSRADVALLRRSSHPVKPEFKRQLEEQRSGDKLESLQYNGVLGVPQGVEEALTGRLRWSKTAGGSPAIVGARQVGC